MPIAQIAERLGRSPATVKAYFYDPSKHIKRSRALPGKSSQNPSALRAAGLRAPAARMHRDKTERIR
jgi:predicted transcriptional regulator